MYIATYSYWTVLHFLLHRITRSRNFRGSMLISYIINIRNTSHAGFISYHDNWSHSSQSPSEISGPQQHPLLSLQWLTQKILQVRTKDGMPATPMRPIEIVSHMIKSRQNHDGSNCDNYSRGGKKRSTGDGLSSSPSNFTPLYPSRMAGGGYSRDGGVMS